jgi:hypothetical protein
MSDASVFVLVLWPGSPEDLPPKVIAVAESLDLAKTVASDYARDTLNLDPPAEWRSFDHTDQWPSEVVGHLNSWQGVLAPEGDPTDFYREERWFEIHQMRLIGVSDGLP